MQQLEIVYSGIKVQYWLEEVQGLPLRSCLCLILTKKKTGPIHIPSPFKIIQGSNFILPLSFSTDMSIKLHPQSIEPWYWL